MISYSPSLTNAELDFTVYEPPYAPDTDWPIAPYPGPVSVAAIVRKPRKRPDRVVDMNGVVHKATDETLETVIQTALIPCKALEPLPTEVYPQGDPLPIDADVQPSLTSEPLPCINANVAKHEGGLAMPKYTLKLPMRTPLGQRVLVPECSRYMSGSDTFWYKFEIMPGMSKWFAENELSLGE